MPVIQKDMDLASAVAIVDHLRMIADHIEQGGQNVYLSGGLLVNANNEIREHNDGFRRVASQAGRSTIELQSDLTLRGVPSYAPNQGIRRFRAENSRYYRWDGEPPRPPKKGEMYSPNSFDLFTVKYALRDLKKPRYIVQEYQP